MKNILKIKNNLHNKLKIKKIKYIQFKNMK